MAARSCRCAKLSMMRCGADKDGPQKTTKKYPKRSSLESVAMDVSGIPFSFYIKANGKKTPTGGGVSVYTYP